MSGQTAMISIRTDKDLKESVGKILQSLGLDHSTVVNMLYRQIQLRKGIPFSIKIPENVSLWDMTKEEQETLLAKATTAAISDLHAKGLPVTFQDEKGLCRQYPDGRKEYIKLNDKKIS
jgi:addiction module RelB/DinJ family antitoxin